MRVLFIILALSFCACNEPGRDDDDDDPPDDVDTGQTCEQIIDGCEADWDQCIHDNGTDALAMCNIAACECVPSSCWDEWGVECDY